MTILKAGSASTLAVIDVAKSILPRVEAGLPSSLNLHALGDPVDLRQGRGVRGHSRGGARRRPSRLDDSALPPRQLAVDGHHPHRDTAGDPVLADLAVLARAPTINVMTLGGLALAVGILVDDGTVTIENINYHLEQGKQIEPAILDGAQQIVIPAFVTLLCLCIVFVPMLQLGGVAGYLFTPLAEAVIFALLGSFILSRTLVPTMANTLLRGQGGHAHAESGGSAARAHRSRNPLRRFQEGFEYHFSRVRNGTTVRCCCLRSADPGRSLPASWRR